LVSRPDPAKNQTEGVSTPLAVIVMGVAGSGKSTIGKALATMLNAPFLEGDQFHSAANIAKMGAGIALDDADRWPWLDRLGAALGEAARQHKAAVAGCSALKRSYRQCLIDAAHVPIRFVFLDGSAETIATRMRARQGHYMPVSLLESQLATLERPAADEDALALPIDAAPEALVAEALAWLRRT